MHLPNLASAENTYRIYETNGLGVEYSLSVHLTNMTSSNFIRLTTFPSVKVIDWYQPVW